MIGELFTKATQGRYKILHLTWFAFFLSFVVWFNFPPFATTIVQEFGLTPAQAGTIGLCNVALTVPARIIIGMLLDRFGPRVTYSCLLIYAAIPCLIFATATSFNQLVVGRLLMGIVGAGFVIGIRMTAEWFPPKEVGTAEGIYGGWGNFGSAFSAFTMVLFAMALSFLPGSFNFGEPQPFVVLGMRFSSEVLNWRAAIAGSGIVAALYGIFYYFNVTDTPPGKVYKRPKSARGMEVTTVRDFWFLMAMNIPLTAILMVLAWRLTKVNFLSIPAMYIVWLCLLGLYAFQAYNCWSVNKDLLAGRKRYPAEDRYRFKQVALLELTYIVNFGSELAVVSILPAFFEGTFGLDKATAGIIAASYAFMNLVSRPGGGIISDSVGSRKWTMTVLLAGMGVGYLIFSMVGSGWSLTLAVLLVMACSFFVQAAEGATFALVPLVKPRITGQIAGNVGAYGNVGAVAYLTTLLLLKEAFVPAGDQIDPALIAAGTARANAAFFQVLGVAGLVVAFLCAFFLDEPKNSFADAHEGEEETVVAPSSSMLS
ncbi:nitrite transporter subfamily [Synechococcus sp. PCC 7335]|uniref:MFS transporter n=1 Tax=Synechococcus sp. (strain ATCC 29403 / PCC 7335) TaxID=91464 RepID=UPI00017EE0BD|nr:MFS transporter [Synechococcus sp. PCC 7335]EDX87413.1 nitrite transporter subfamily [Synechococcus sp. PCC 7335]